MLRKLVFRLAVGKKLRQERRAGRLSKSEFKRLKRAATPEALGSIQEELELKGGDRPVLEAIWKFVVENWDEILKVLITLATLVLDGDE